MISSMADAFAELSSQLDADVVDIESDVSTERDPRLRLVLCTLRYLRDMSSILFVDDFTDQIINDGSMSNIPMMILLQDDLHDYLMVAGG